MVRLAIYSTSLAATAVLALAASATRLPTLAVITDKATTITATNVPGSTGLAIIDGKTYSSGKDLTLSNGDVISVVKNGLADSKTTAAFAPYNSSPIINPSVTNSVIVSPINSFTSAGQSSSASAMASSSSSAASNAKSTATAAKASATGDNNSPDSNAATKQRIDDGKVVALVGALAAVVLCGL